MELFDSKFYLEKKKRISINKSNKYRRRSSIAAEIEQYFQQKMKDENKNVINHNSDASKDDKSKSNEEEKEDDDGIEIEADGINLDFDKKRIHFPIYERSATKILSNDNIISNKNIIDVTLTNTDWIIIYSSIALECIRGISGEVVTKWFSLYVVIRFNSSISYSYAFIATAAIGAIVGIIFFGYLRDNICKRLIYGKNKNKLNKKEDIIITACCSITNIFAAILVILWMDPFISYLNYGFILMFIAGYIVAGITALVPNLLIASLNTEHLEPKILSIKVSLSWITSAVSLLILGFLWNISIDWFLYILIIANACTTIISLFIISVAMKINIIR